MRYDDARPWRETGSLWLRLQLLWARAISKTHSLPYTDLSALSDHDLQDIGLTRREAETGRRLPPLL